MKRKMTGKSRAREHDDQASRTDGWDSQAEFQLCPAGGKEEYAESERSLSHLGREPPPALLLPLHSSPFCRGHPPSNDAGQFLAPPQQRLKQLEKIKWSLSRYGSYGGFHPSPWPSSRLQASHTAVGPVEAVRTTVEATQ